MSVLYKYSLIVAMIAKSGEEYATGEKGYLESLDIDVDSVLVPCPCPNSPRNDRCKYSVKVQQEDDRHNAASDQCPEEQAR